MCVVFRFSVFHHVCLKICREFALFRSSDRSQSVMLQSVSVTRSCEKNHPIQSILIDHSPISKSTVHENSFFFLRICFGRFSLFCVQDSRIVHVKYHHQINQYTNKINHSSTSSSFLLLIISFPISSLLVSI